MIIEENLINPLYNLWDDIKIKNDYVIGDENIQHKFHYYLDKFHYEIKINKNGLLLNCFYWVWKVNTTWFREIELLTDRKRFVSEKLIEDIYNKYIWKVWDIAILWILGNVSNIGNLIIYNDGLLEKWEIEKILISWNIEYKYHPISWKKLKWLFKNEIIRFVIWGKEYCLNDLKKELN